MWPQEVIGSLCILAREKAFDFAAVSVELKKRVEGRDDISVDAITPDSCRVNFSQTFFSSEEVSMPQPVEPTASDEVEKFLSTNYTFDEALSFVNKLKEDSLIRQELVFTRVFHALETDKGSVQDIPAINMDSDVYTAWNNRKLKNELERLEKEKAAKEHEERQILATQRDRLSKRFNSDSEDAQGIDPFRAAKPKSSVLTDLDEMFHDSTEKEEFLTKHFNMGDFLNSEHLDQLLEIIEKENDELSCGKVDEKGEVSELGDVLKYLDSYSVIKNAMDKDSADFVVENVINKFSRDALKVARAFENDAAENKTASLSSMAKTPVRVVDEPRTVIHKENLPPPPPTNQIKLLEQKEPVVPRSRRVIETILDDSDEDDDSRNNWRSMRSKLKEQADIEAPEAMSNTKVMGVWGEKGLGTEESAAGLLALKKKEKFNLYNRRYFQYGEVLMKKELSIEESLRSEVVFCPAAEPEDEEQCEEVLPEILHTESVIGVSTKDIQADVTQDDEAESEENAQSGEEEFILEDDEDIVLDSDDDIAANSAYQPPSNFIVSGIFAH